MSVIILNYTFSFDAIQTLYWNQNKLQSESRFFYSNYLKYPINHFLDMDEEISCPYCETKCKTKEELSTHIDRIHHGKGLLEGDTRKY